MLSTTCCNFCMTCCEDIINTDGDNEETWEKFDEHFTKLLGQMPECERLEACDASLQLVCLEVSQHELGYKLGWNEIRHRLLWQRGCIGFDTLDSFLL